MDGSHAPNVIAEVNALGPELEARAQEMEDLRRLPADLADKLAATGAMRLLTRADIGGLEMPPADFFEAIEAVATHNASAGWCAMIASTAAMSSAYLAKSDAEEIFGDPMVITGGIFAPMGRAIDEGDAYRVTGRWPWGSGSVNCRWIMGGCLVEHGDDVVRLSNGAPRVESMFFPAGEVDLIDTWDVAGLKGTGSGDVAVRNVRVPKSRTFSLVADRPRRDTALYVFPAFGLLALGVAAVASGNARAALAAFLELATQKGSQGSRKTLSERSTVQRDTADAMARLTAARALVMTAVETAWTAASQDGAISQDQRADLRLACTHLVRTGADLCRQMYEMGGGAALYTANPLQRHFRDAYAATQHIAVAPATLELVGRVKFGLPTDDTML